MITESAARVEFHGGRARTGPVTWGQQGTWDGIHGWLPEIKPFFFLTKWLPVPLLLEVGDVLDVLGELVLRHESLRTHFRTSPNGEVTQEVLGSGTLPVTVHDRPADDPVEFSDVVATCWRRGSATPFDHDRELPIRLSVALHEGIPVLVVIVFSHLAADHTATDLLAAELTALLQARVDGVPPPPPRPALQPVDIALAERSPDGQLLGVDALRHLRAALDRMPPATPARADPGSPRYVGADLESDVLPVAVRAAARRYRVTTSVLLLAVTTALVRCACPGPLHRLDVMQGNRATPELMGSVTTLNQVVHTVADLRADSFADLLGRAARTMSDARAHARYDNRAAAQVVRAWGGVLEPGTQFNDMWSTLPRPRGTARPDPGATELTWPATSDAENMLLYLDVRGTPERMRLGLMADTAVLPRPEIGGFLLAFERVAVELAEHDVPLERIGELFAEQAGRVDR
ncbi:hypothetical protein [Saccharothrix sp. Mg75]|uniref:hypothetical protein n=1 Tax=Saccharothrix sp. Mg75 TaxID=3445357 RepID=UPI003EEB774B